MSLSMACSCMSNTDMTLFDSLQYTQAGDKVQSSAPSADIASIVVNGIDMAQCISQHMV